MNSHNAMKNRVLIAALCLSFNSWAGVYKCTDVDGHTHYQSSPCAEAPQAVHMNTKTGSSVDLNELEKQQALEAEQKKQQELALQAEQQAKLEEIAQRKKLAQAQSELTQTLIKQNPTQFSAYAIPPYDPENLSTQVKPFDSRLPDIEKFRRLAAQKALASGQCQRVEADELSPKSTKEALVFLVNCSSGASFYFNETELQ